MIRACDEHGFFDADACPDCGDDGDRVLDEERRTRLSKFLSGALRHFPDDAGVSLSEQGWASDDAVVEAATSRYDWADHRHVEAVIATDPRGRFERRGDRIRAAYGHSVDVELESTEESVPDRLYHGTAPRNLDSIEDDGLRPMGRQQVHLSGSPETAREVGARHADDPVVLVVDAEGIREAGIDVDRRGEETYTAECVPPEYLDLLAE